MLKQKITKIVLIHLMVISKKDCVIFQLFLSRIIFLASAHRETAWSRPRSSKRNFDWKCGRQLFVIVWVETGVPHIKQNVCLGNTSSGKCLLESNAFSLPAIKIRYILYLYIYYYIQYTSSKNGTGNKLSSGFQQYNHPTNLFWEVRLVVPGCGPMPPILNYVYNKILIVDILIQSNTYYSPKSWIKSKTKCFCVVLLTWLVGKYPMFIACNVAYNVTQGFTY